MYVKINKVLKEKISPILQEHYGDIELVEYKDGVAKVKMLGVCGNCPSAQLTLENVVSTLLKEEIPEIKEVVLHKEVSQDLLNMAKKILNKDK